MWNKIWSGIKIGFEWFLKGMEGADYWDGYLGVPIYRPDEKDKDK